MLCCRTSAIVFKLCALCFSCLHSIGELRATMFDVVFNVHACHGDNQEYERPHHGVGKGHTNQGVGRLLQRRLQRDSSPRARSPTYQIGSKRNRRNENIIFRGWGDTCLVASARVLCASYVTIMLVSCTGFKKFGPSQNNSGQAVARVRHDH